MFQPFISVIIPCFNQAKFLPDALQSIYDQTFTGWECIIVNDGSSDNTEDVALEWCGKDNRFKYVKKKNGGLSSARNAGLEVISGKFVQFLDADDIININKFSTQIAVLKNSEGLALSYSDYFSSTEQNLKEPHPRYQTPRFKTNEYLKNLITDWEERLSIPNHCFLFDSRLFNDYKNLFDETLPNHEDWECWMNVFALNPQVFYIDEKLATYRIRVQAMCADTGLMKKGFLQAIAKQRRKHKNNPEIKALLIKRYNKIKFENKSAVDYYLSKMNPLLLYRNWNENLHNKINQKYPEISRENSFWNSFKYIVKEKVIKKQS